ncbi:MAG TPA: hypothetical protein PLO27_01685 [Marmoricola sp.]|nr:hypothetical protein [Marmoricola sp.]
MESIFGGFAAPIAAGVGALIVGSVTVIGVVQSQVSAGNSPIGSVSQKVADYGTNSKF